MRISKKDCPGATLPEDRKGVTEIDGSNSLLLSRADYAMYLENISMMSIKNMRFSLVSKSASRVKRFFSVIPAVWRFCK